MIRVFVADDHAVVRDGLHRLFGSTRDLRVVGTAARAAEISDDWDVLVLDLSMPEGGLAAVRAHQPAVVYTMYSEAAYAPRVFDAGARGFVHKSRPVEHLIEAIRLVAAGGRYVSDDALSAILTGATGGHTALSPREMQIFERLVADRSPSQIAEDLSLSRATVSTHVAHIRDKLNVRSNLGLVAYAFRMGLAE